MLTTCLQFDILHAATCDFQHCGILTSVDSDQPVQPFLCLEIPYYVQPVAYHLKNIRATSKGSDQTVHMHSLICGFAGRTYHIVGNLMSWLN